LITEKDLRAAADTIDEASDAELQHKLDKLKEALNARTQREVLRQQAELDSLELDQAAYQLASQAAKDGDLANAAHWYRVAAKNDFADSPLKLAEVLGALADKYLARQESRMTVREEMELVSEAARWYAAAYAAGDIEAAEFLEELMARHDPTRLRARPAPSGATGDTDLTAHADLDASADTRSDLDADATADIDPDPDPDTCTLGGLWNVVHLQLAETTAHCGPCRQCQKELIKGWSAMVARTLPSDNGTRLLRPMRTAAYKRLVPDYGFVLHSQTSRPR
jgi:hypothetical protein